MIKVRVNGIYLCFNNFSAVLWLPNVMGKESPDKYNKLTHETSAFIMCLESNTFDVVNMTWNPHQWYKTWWSWSYGSWIYNYLCNQCLSPLKLWVRIMLMVRCTWYNILWASLSVTCDRSVVFSGYSCFLHQ